MRKVFLIVFLLVSSATLALAQKTEKFKGEIKVNKEETANARFDYIQNKEEKILDGEYEIEFSKRDSLFDLDFTKILWSGKFKKNKRVGEWTFRQDDHLLTINDVRDFNVNYALITNRKVLNAQYSQSVREGDWRFSKQTFIEGGLEKQISDSKMSFKNGHLISYFNLDSKEEDTFRVEGKFDEKGFLDNEWVFVYWQDSLKITEKRLYENGFLLKILKTSNNDTIQEVNFEDAKEKLALLKENPDSKTIKVADKGFPLLFDLGYHPSNEAILAQKQANQLLYDKLMQMLKMDTAISRNKPNLLKTARFEFTITEEFKKDIELAKQYTDSIKNIIHTPDMDNFFEINSQKTDSMSWIYNYFSLVDQHIDSIGEVLDMNEKDFKYINTSIYFSDHLKFLNEADTISYQFGDETKTKIINYQTFNINDIAYLKLRLEEELKKVEILAWSVQEELDKSMRSQKLEQLDRNILKAKGEVDSIFQEHDTIQLSHVLGKIRKEFVERGFNQHMQHYSNAKDFDQKIEVGYEILNYLDELRNIPQRIRDIELMEEKIEEAYTTTKFDPYTFNYDFETKIKRRIYDKAAVDLYNYLILLLQQEKNFQSLKKRLDLIDALQFRLLELLGEDTRRLERRMKRKSNPEEIIELLELNEEI
ncbi:hypothetical protein JKA74_03255 [Marivirga sp. S37H4]|uniref:Uncharacterized protein n=1 Tax=Marivirga aurantiaca TaxID=2802615 RepID=A0A935C940_9BACT|nr:hypothetical protein [Marivirga aurantiaca]MBK6264043.1 hypothetical protein [Marivirga aurantiaca]